MRIVLWGFVAIVAVFVALGVFAKNDSLAKAVRCNEFKPLADGTWVAAQDVSLAYGWRTIGGLAIGSYQLSYGKGSAVTGHGGTEDARLFAALNEVCRK
jgi:hypothetical protein